MLPYVFVVGDVLQHGQRRLQRMSEIPQGFARTLQPAREQRQEPVDLANQGQHLRRDGLAKLRDFAALEASQIRLHAA